VTMQSLFSILEVNLQFVKIGLITKNVISVKF